MDKFKSNAVMAGVLIGLAFFIARLAMVRSMRDFMLAAGTALLELAIVLFLDWKAKRLETAIEAWELFVRSFHQATELLRVATDAVLTRDNRIAELRNLIKAIEVEHLQGRVWGVNLEANKDLAIAAARAGYLAGIAENRIANINAKEAA